MIKKEEVYKIGLFNKPHGIHGELQFTFTDDIFDRVDCDYLVCLLDGIFVPFFMEEYRFRSDSTALVKLEGVDTAERARMFTNVEVYFPVKHAEEAGEGELSWEFFVGFRMEDVHHGMLGEVVDSLSKEDVASYAKRVIDKLQYGSNIRGSKQYRKQLSKVLISRCISRLTEE